MVPVVDLSRLGAARAQRFASVAADVSASGRFLLGEQTECFERDFGAWLMASESAIGAAPPSDANPPFVATVASGASALQLALAALGIGVGDEVIVPAFTAVPTAAAVCAVGATPVPVDVLADTANLDPALVAAATTDRTRAVIVVHLYGQAAVLPDTHLPIIEDAAQAHGAVANHRRSAATAYSFYPTKNLGGIGDGGAVVTFDAEIDARARRLRVHGMTELYVHDEISQNFRMSEVEAAWLRLALEDLTVGNARRRQIAHHYREQAPSLRWQRESAEHVFHLCVARSSHRDEFRAACAELDVATAIHYPLAITEQPAYRRFTRATCTESQAWARECVTVPCFPEMTDAEIDLVGCALADIASRPVLH
ncbi:MAG: DegT/DnrJ/EryC1/StrS family aminotransferase [Ilumatobacteraceae bacterium]